MRRYSQGSAGFSFVELLVVVAVVTLLSLVAAMSLSALRERLILREARDAVMFHLEESKARAVAGTGGLPQGVYFDDTSYVQFQGAAYDDMDPANVVHPLHDRLQVTTDILDGSDAVVFSRITGRAGAAARITLTLDNDAGKQAVITVGPGGDIAIGQ